MSLSRTALSTIQQAGAAVFAADTELKNAVTDYAERVHAAMGANPYGLGNDALFENWKLAARLSQTMAGIEQELKKVYQLAADLAADDSVGPQAAPALAAPIVAVEPGVARGNDLTPTDVWVKTRTLSANPARLLRHFERVLNPNQFTKISQTASAQATGIALGSISAAIKKLVETGHIIAGPAGGLRLAH